MKLAVYAIAKNEAAHVERWYNSIKDADGVFITDTGSSDNTLDIANSLGIETNAIVLNEFRFDAARNASLMRVPPEFDYVMFMDLDEVLEEGGIQKIKDAISKSREDAYYVDVRGNYNGNNLIFRRLAVHTKSFSWKYPVHEVLHINKPYSSGVIPVVVNHLPDANKSRASYLNLLKLGCDEFPDDPRCLMYYGRELLFNNNGPSAVTYLSRALTLDPNPELRCQIAMHLADCFSYDGLHGEEATQVQLAKECYLLRACSEYGYAREPFVQLYYLYMDMGMPVAAYGVMRRADLITSKVTTLLVGNEDLYDPVYFYHILAVAAYDVGDIPNAKRYMLEVLKASNGNLNEAQLHDVHLIFKDSIEVVEK